MPHKSSKRMRVASRVVVVDGLSYELSYELVRSDKDGALKILFLHGWGAKKELMRDAFSKHFMGFEQLYLDLSGFGASSLPAKALNSAEYSKVVHSFLKSLNFSPDVLLGHSFGGKICSLLASKLNPSLLVLLSSAGLPQPKPIWLKLKIALFKLFKLFGLGFMRKFFASADVRGMDSVMYESFKAVVDEDFSPVFKQLNGQRVLIFWGKDDKATPLRTGEQMSLLLKNSKLRVFAGGHFFFLDYAKDIAMDIKQSLKDS